MTKALYHLRRLFAEERGQAIVLTAVCMVGILAFVGLSVDIGHLRYTEEQLQTAADAAALSGALELSACGTTANCTTMQTAAQQALVENGLAGSQLLTQCASRTSDVLTLTVNNGPCYLGSTTNDPKYGNSSYVEAVVTSPEPTFFMGIIGITSFDETARAEAGYGNSPDCLYAKYMFADHGSHITVDCGISLENLETDNGSHVDATAITYTGTYTDDGGTPTPTPVSTTIPWSDPLSGLAEPSVGSCTTVSTINSTTSMNQGTYCGIDDEGNLTLNPGTYVLTGNFSVGNGATLTGTGGVTIYFSSGTFQLSSGSKVDLVAPTTGTYAGILMYQSATDTSDFYLDSGSGSVWQGALYLPGATLYLNSGANAAAYTIAVANTVHVESGAKFTLGADYSSLPGGSPIKSVISVLVE